MNLRDELAEVEAKAEHLRRRIGASTCAEAGCDMQFVGGANAGCGEDCNCSVPVYECTRCHDSDYGDSPEAVTIRERCQEGFPNL